MASRKNPFGQTDYIPAGIRKEVRRRSRFGCVICRLAPCQYDHFDPEFKDLKGPPTADGIALLCTTCHEKKKWGEITTERIRDAYFRDDKGPARYEPALDPTKPARLKLGVEDYGDVELFTGDRMLLKFKYAEASGWLLDMQLYDDRGSIVCCVEENVIHVGDSAKIDFSHGGGWLTWRTQPSNEIAVKLKVLGGCNTLHFTKLRGWLGGIPHVITEAGYFVPLSDAGTPSAPTFEVRGKGAKLIVKNSIVYTDRPGATPLVQKIGDLEIRGSDAAVTSPGANSNAPRKPIGRNDACPCGSGRKYKKCCGSGAAG